MESKENNRSRWFALINDKPIIAPRQKVRVSVLKELASIPIEHSLYRDIDNPEDVLCKNTDNIDLVDGNVFYSTECLYGESKANPKTCAKLAFLVNDHFEIATIRELSYETFFGLFNLEKGLKLFRDFESPNDPLIMTNSKINFADGPVFYTRCGECEPSGEIKIIVNGREKTVSKADLSYEEVVRLAYIQVNPNGVYTVVYRNGVNCVQGSMVKGDIVKIKNGMMFNVTETCKS